MDIGGGIGLHSFYAASKGARQVLCLEPEADGSEMQINEKFNYISKTLNYDNIVIKNSTFQSYFFRINMILFPYTIPSITLMNNHVKFTY